MTNKINKKAYSDDQIINLMKRTNISYVIMHDQCVYDITGLMTMIIIKSNHNGTAIPPVPSSHEFDKILDYIQSEEIKHILQEIDSDYSEQLIEAKTIKFTNKSTNNSTNNSTNKSRRNVSRNRNRSLNQNRINRINMANIINTYLDRKIDLIPYGTYVAINKLGKHIKPERNAANFLRF